MKVPICWFVNKLSILALAALPASWAAGWHAVRPLLEFPAWPGQLVALVGAGLFVAHYFGLRRRVQRIGDPERLERGFGLYPHLRHPMYFGDLLLLAGLWLIFPTVPGLALWLTGSVAAVLLARHEDAYLAARFVEFGEWKARSRLIIPGIF